MKGIVIADQHFGVIGAEELYLEHDKIFFEYLKSDIFDVIFIAGDFFDHILYLNESHANKACLFMDRLFEEARRMNSKIRIIYGTESHECNQYSIFLNRVHTENLDIKVIRHVEEEELFPDIWVLYLPEEYIYNKDEYYKDFFTGEEKYNYIIGHGVIQELMSDASFHMNRSSKTSARAKVPVFTSRELLENCCGEVYFGHYHVNSSIKDRIFYVGSFTRWCYGEEAPKGFYSIEFKKDKYHHEFIENTMAKKYNTITYGYENPIFHDKESMEKEIKKVRQLVDKGMIDNVRLVMNIPEDYQDAESTIVMMGEQFKGQDKIKVKITNGYVNKTKKINKEYLTETMKKYSYIFDKSMPISEQAHNFIKTKFNEDIPADIIEWHLKTGDVLHGKKMGE